MLDFIIRKAVSEDAADLESVMNVLSCDLNPQIAAGLIDRIANDSQKYLMVAVDMEKDLVCGCLMGVIFEDITGDGRPILLLENFAVLPAYQRHGIGAALLERMESWAKEYNCHYELLVSGFEREGAHKFYQRNGFEEAKGFRKFYR